MSLVPHFDEAHTAQCQESQNAREVSRINISVIKSHVSICSVTNNTKTIQSEIFISLYVFIQTERHSDTFIWHNDFNTYN